MVNLVSSLPPHTPQHTPLHYFETNLRPDIMSSLVLQNAIVKDEVLVHLHDAQIVPSVARGSPVSSRAA